MKFFDAYFESEQGKFHYLDNRSASKNLILLFPGGIFDARFVTELNFGFEFNNFRIISLTYPSRYRSSEIKATDTIDRINSILIEGVNQIFSETEYSTIQLVGFSFGTMILTKLLQNHTFTFKISTPKLKLILVNPGEFFNVPIKNLLSSIFRPALKSKSYAVTLRALITDVLKIFKKSYFPDNRLKDINEQWITTLNYKIDSKKIIKYPTIIFTARNDLVIRKRSVSLLKKVFPDLTNLEYPGGHIYEYATSSHYQTIKPKFFAVLLENIS